MTEPRIYIPVGINLTTAQMRRITFAQLQNRDLFDPRYAGFQKDFHWQDYISLQLSDPAFRSHVMQALDQFATTQEGQHAIRQAAAMQTYRKFGTVHPSAKQKQAGRVPIVDVVDASMGSNYSMAAKTLFLDATRIPKVEYLGQNGQYYDPSLQSVVFHELQHAMDGLMSDHNYRVLSEVHFSNIPGKDFATLFTTLREKFVAPVIEYPAILNTNDFVWNGYREPQRVLNLEAWRLESLPHHPPSNVQPNLSEDRFYPSILPFPVSASLSTPAKRAR